MNLQVKTNQPKAVAPPTDDRRETIANAIDAMPSKALKVTGDSIEEIVAKIFYQGHEMKPGEAMRVIGLLPNKGRDNMMRIAMLYEKAKEMGKHGAPLILDLAKRTGLELEMLVRICEALNSDRMVKTLANKRGNDSKRDIPAMTRRDHVEAALNAHGG